MRNKLFIFLSALAVTALVASCVKSSTLPVYVPNPTYVFQPSSLLHTKDSVNVGDTVYLNATGTVYDTTKTISVWVTSSYSGSVAGTYTYGTAAVPVKVSRVIGSLGSNNLYSWSAKIPVLGATSVAHKSTLALTATFVYQLSLSSQLPSSLSLFDGQPTYSKPKTVYVK